MRSVVSGVAPACQRREEGSETRRHLPPRGHFPGEGGRGGGVWELASEEQEPDVLEGALAGQFDGRVLPIVEETLLAAHVADGGIGHHHPLQSSRKIEVGRFQFRCRVHIPTMDLTRGVCKR